MTYFLYSTSIVKTRHIALRDLLCTMVHSKGVFCIIEMQVEGSLITEMPLSKQKRRRFDIVITDPDSSLSTLGINVTAVSTQNQKLLRLASQTTGGAANEAEKVMVLEKVR